MYGRSRESWGHDHFLEDRLFPSWLSHVGSHIPLEDDQIFLHIGELEYLEKRSKGLSLGQAYYMPSKVRCIINLQLTQDAQSTHSHRILSRVSQAICIAFCISARSNNLAHFLPTRIAFMIEMQLFRKDDVVRAT